MSVRLHLTPVKFAEARQFVEDLHRHHKAPLGYRFAVGVADEDGVLRGVATAGRPIARAFDDGLTVEINRTCTDGARNANSMLYGACLRASWALGYRRVVTYTQKDESGSSLKAAGFKVVAELPPRGDWAASSVRRIREASGVGGVARTLWEATTP